MDDGTDSRRLVFVDNIRWVMILLVLSMHATDTYSPFGNWYYRERHPMTLGTALSFATYQSFLQAFFMGLLFFLGGCFAAASLQRKGPREFARGRLLRLGVPTLLFMFVIGPLTQYYLSHTWGSGGFAHQWQLHITDGQILSETGPMWFAAILLVFSLSLVLGQMAGLIRGKAAVQAAATSAPPKPLPPIGPRSSTVVAFVVVLTLTTYGVRIACPEDVAVLNIHPGDLPQYVGMFCAGIIAARRNWLTGVPFRLGMYWAGVLLLAAAPLFAGLLLWGGALDGDASQYSGGPNAVSLLKCLWESLICVGMTFGLCVAFRGYWARSTALTRLLAENSFAVYLIHPPVLIALAMMLTALDAAPAIKALILTLATAVATFTASQLLLRRIPGLRRIL